MSRVLQLLEIFEIQICHISEFFWLPKVTSNLSKQLTERDDSGKKNKVYVKIVDNLYGIVTSRRNLDGLIW